MNLQILCLFSLWVSSKFSDNLKMQKLIETADRSCGTINTILKKK